MLWDILVSIFWFMLLFAWIWLLVMIFSDLFRDHELSGWAKAAWALFLVVLPWLGALVYLVARGRSMNERAREQAVRNQQDFRRYVRGVTGSSPSTADELAKLADLRDRGVFSPRSSHRPRRACSAPRRSAPPIRTLARVCPSVEVWVSGVWWSQQRGPAGAKRLRRRCTDRLEDAAAWVLTALGMFVLLLSVLVGVRTGAEAAEQGRVSEHERVRVEAEVLFEAAVPDQDPDADLDWVSVRYTDGAGRVHEAEVPATGPPSAGTTVPMWVDRAGRPAAAPPGALEAVVLGAVVGLGIAAAGLRYSA